MSNMGVDTRRPLLPAPTEDPSSMDNESNLGTDLATNVSRRTDKTSYSIPEDGSPITISTSKNTRQGLIHHSRQKSQTSLLIEYFEAGRAGDKLRTRPSVRVRVTPSAARKSRTTSDAVQITGIGKDRKPSYTRRISLGNRTDPPVEGTELSRSTGSNVSGHPPVEIEVMDPQRSDLSGSHLSRDLRYLPNTSDVSSMPPDSLLDAAANTTSANTAAADIGSLQRPRSRSLDRQQDNNATTTVHEYLEAPTRTRSRSLSRERITQKVMEKLAARPVESTTRRRRPSRDGPIEYEPDTKPIKERRRRSSKSHNTDSAMSPESSQISSNITNSQTSYRSAGSKVSLTNPRLLEMVEDTVRRLILPEINQIRKDNRSERRSGSYTESRRTSGAARDSYDEEIVNSTSIASDAPCARSKPKVVLNRDGLDPGEVLSRGDSERTQHRSRRRHKDSFTEDSQFTSTDKESHRIKDAVAGAMASGVLTAAALKNHDTAADSSRERRKKRGKSHSSRSRSASVTESRDHYARQDIPPMPFAGPIDSEVTRNSILSANTERPSDLGSRNVETPIQDVQRYDLVDTRSSPTVTATRTPVTARNVGSRLSQRSSHEIVEHSPRSINSKSGVERTMAMAAAGAAGAAIGHHLNKQQSGYHSMSEISPVQSASSLREDRDPLIPEALRPHSTASTSHTDVHHLNGPSPLSSPRHSPLMYDRTSFAERSKHRAIPDLGEGTSTPRADEFDEWFSDQRQENNRYRDIMADSPTQSADDHRVSRYTEESNHTSHEDHDQDVRNGLGIKPSYVQTPHGVESAVASLLDPSMVSSSVRSSELGQTRPARPLSDVIVENIGSVRDVTRPSPAPYEVEAAQHFQTAESPDKNRWTAIRERAQALSDQASSGESQAHHQGHVIGTRHSNSSAGESPIHLGASGIPLANDPLPEIGHGIDSGSDVTTNPSDIQGPFSAKEGGWASREQSPTKNDRQFSFQKNDDASDMTKEHHSHGATALGAGILATGAAVATTHAFHDQHTDRGEHSSREDDREALDSHTPGLLADTHREHSIGKGPSPASGLNVDEGYASAAYARSGGADTPRAGHEDDRGLSAEELAEYEATMNEYDDHFGKTKSTGVNHSRHVSSNSHGMGSPLYDSATGRGLDRIQSKDIVALMDHLTVRDAQRNARDTEILVTLVRNATEMRGSFEQMKKYIAEQDRMIMKNTDRDADMTVNRVLNGPRPQPQSIPRSPRQSYDEDDRGTPVKRKNIFKRALKGLGKRDSNDLVRIEDMLMQLLDDVEVLKTTQGTDRFPLSEHYNESVSGDRQASLSSYDKLRVEDDYHLDEREDFEDRSTTPTQAKYQVSPPRKHEFHSGYDGRRDSINRVSTVMEGEEEDDDHVRPHGARFMDNDNHISPKKGSRRSGTGYEARVSFDEKGLEPMTDKQQKHKSNGSSILGSIPRISRWSKTTDSSVPDGYDSRRQSQEQKPYSDASSGSRDSLDKDGTYYDDRNSVDSYDRPRSMRSLTQEDLRSAASPLSGLKQNCQSQHRPAYWSSPG